MPHPVWSSDGAVPPLSGGLARDVLERLGVALDRPDLDGLGRLYEAWRAQLGMENFSKRIALLEATDPTETARTPEATFEAFLRHGSSGTCWSTMEAFTALLKAAGFDARTYGGEMTGPGEMNHGTVVVVLDGRRYSVDQNLLWPAPLPLHPGEATQVEGPHYRAEARYEPERRGFRIRRLGGASEHRPTFLIDRELCREDYRQAWQRSCQRSIFNQGYFIIRIRSGSWRRLENARYREMPAGGPLRESTPPADLPGFVAERFGLDAGLVARLLELERRAGIQPPSQGGLDAG